MSTQKGRVSPTKRGVVTPLPDLPETSASPTRVSAAVTGMFHKRPNASLRPRRTLPDPPGLYTTNIRIYNEPHSSLGQDICAASAHSRTIFLYNSSVHNNVTPIYLIIMNNTSLSYNSTYIRLLQELLNDPDFSRHHTRSLPVKTAISHGDHESRQPK